jgi:hypothetical protein
MFADDCEVFWPDSGPYAPKELVLEAYDWEFDDAANIEFLIVNDALI